MRKIALAFIVMAASVPAVETVTRRFSADVNIPDQPFTLVFDRGSDEYVEVMTYQDGAAFYPSNFTGGYLWYADSRYNSTGVLSHVSAITLSSACVRVSSTNTLGLSTNDTDYPITYPAVFVLTNADRRVSWNQGTVTIRPQAGVTGASYPTSVAYVETDPVALSRINAGVWRIRGGTRTYMGTDGVAVSNAWWSSIPGDIIDIGPGFYSIGGAFNPTNHSITIRGAGPGIYDTAAERISTTGTLISACIGILGTNVTIQNFGLTTNNQPDILFASSADGRSDSPKNFRMEDINIYASAATTHNFEFRGKGIFARNIKTYGATHNFVIKGHDAVVDGLYSWGGRGSGAYIKSDNSIPGASSNVVFRNVVIDGPATVTNSGFIVGTDTTQFISNCSISGLRVRNCNYGVYLYSLGDSGIVRDIFVTDFQSTRVNKHINIGTAAQVTNVWIVNTAAMDCYGYGYSNTATTNQFVYVLGFGFSGTGTNYYLGYRPSTEINSTNALMPTLQVRGEDSDSRYLTASWLPLGWPYNASSSVFATGGLFNAYDAGLMMKTNTAFPRCYYSYAWDSEKTKLIGKVVYSTRAAFATNTTFTTTTYGTTNGGPVFAQTSSSFTIPANTSGGNYKGVVYFTNTIPLGTESTMFGISYASAPLSAISNLWIHPPTYRMK